nr:MAG TPA: cysteine sulfinate desulfinase/cysteine desulfurase [Caudoviricetes sp.]
MYLDNAATTPLTPQVKDYIISLLDTYQNPSSMYQSGVNAKQIITTARNDVAKFINANPEDVIFTSSGSASNNLAVRGYIGNALGYFIMYSPIAHKSMIKCVEQFHPHQCQPIPVDKQGFFDLKEFEKCINTHTHRLLVALDYANSEIGTIQKIKEIIDITHKYNGIVYLDCTGSISQIPLDVKALDVDMIGFSAHKLSALKGVGVLYKKKHIYLEPLIYGSQEQGLFGGTENVIGIAALGKAVENYDYSSITSNNRDYIYNYINNNISDSYLVGADLKHRLPHNLYICFKGIEGESLMTLLDINGYQVSTGSACTSGDLTPSSTLLAIEINKEDINSCIRITLSGKEEITELNKFCEVLKRCVETLRQLNK